MNEIREKKKLSIPRVFLEQYKDFLVIILIVSAAISGLLGDIKSSISDSRGDYNDADSGNCTDNQSRTVNQ